MKFEISDMVGKVLEDIPHMQNIGSIGPAVMEIWGLKVAKWPKMTIFGDFSWTNPLLDQLYFSIHARAYPSLQFY